MYPRTMCIGLASLIVGAGAIEARGQAPDDDAVSREEYETLRDDFEALKADMEAMKGQRGVMQAQPGESADEPDWLETERARLRIEVLEEAMEETKGGLSNFHITGFAFTTFVNKQGMDSTFNAKVVPLFLWEITDRLLFEAEIEFELEVEDGEGKTEVVLEYADLSYIVNDYIVLGAGKFLTPFGLFAERLHPAWINKFASSPLIYGHHGIAPFTSLGIYARGGFPAGPTMFNYAIYLSNGPALDTGAIDPDEAGVLGFNNFSDINNGKSVGGRIGFLPVPAVEIGFSFNWGQVNPSGSGIVVQNANAFLWGVDLTYVQEVDCLAGLFDVRFEYVHSDVDDVTYFLPPPDGPLTFDNVRDGLYVQAAYRPTKCSVKFLRNFEVVGRYDYLNLPAGAPENEDQQRWSVGLNYWLNPSTVLKFSWEHLMVKGEPDTDAFLAMFAVGF